MDNGTGACRLGYDQGVRRVCKFFAIYLSYPRQHQIVMAVMAVKKPVSWALALLQFFVFRALESKFNKTGACRLGLAGWAINRV